MSANPTKMVGGKDHYNDQMENGMANGSGKITFADGNEYNGEWENGKMHGNGIMRFADGDVYEGEWENGKEHGSGVMTFAERFDKYVYKGAWENGKMNGSGVMKFAGVDVYQGDFENGNIRGTPWRRAMYRFFLQIDVESALQATEARRAYEEACRAYEGSTMLELAIWKSKIAEQTDGNINLLTSDMRMGCRIDSLWMVEIILPNVLSFLCGKATNFVNEILEGNNNSDVHGTQ